MAIKLIPKTQVFIHELGRFYNAFKTPEPNIYATSITFPANTTELNKVYTLEVYANDQPTGVSIPLTVYSINEDIVYYDVAGVKGQNDLIGSEGSTIAIEVYFKMEGNSIVVLPEDAMRYFENTYPDTYNTMTQVPEEIDTSNVTTMNGMFFGCSAIKTIPEMDTSKVTDMRGMFQFCEALTTVPYMDTSNVTIMHIMFDGCKALTTVPYMNTSNVTTMNQMFSGCSAIKTIPEMDTSKVTDMNNMFNGCKALTTVPYMDTSKVTDMNQMFYPCESLTTIDWEIDMSSCTVCTSMFAGCDKLSGVRLKNVPSGLDLSKLGLDSSKYTVVNYI